MPLKYRWAHPGGHGDAGTEVPSNYSSIALRRLMRLGLVFVETVSGGSSGGTRPTVTKTTASLAAGASEAGTITLAKAYRLYRVQTSRPARVRLYTTAAKRDADAARAVGTDPTGDHGLILDVVTTSDLLAFDLSPVVDGWDAKATPDGEIPISITNRDTVTGTVDVTFTYATTES